MCALFLRTYKHKIWNFLMFSVHDIRDNIVQCYLSSHSVLMFIARYESFKVQMLNRKVIIWRVRENKWLYKEGKLKTKNARSIFQRQPFLWVMKLCILDYASFRLLTVLPRTTEVYLTFQFHRHCNSASIFVKRAGIISKIEFKKGYHEQKGPWEEWWL